MTNTVTTLYSFFMLYLSLNPIHHVAVFSIHHCHLQYAISNALTIT